MIAIGKEECLSVDSQKGPLPLVLKDEALIGSGVERKDLLNVSAGQTCMPAK